LSKSSHCERLMLSPQDRDRAFHAEADGPTHADVREFSPVRQPTDYPLHDGEGAERAS